MLRFAILVILIAAIRAIPIIDYSESAHADVIIVDNIDEYLALNPEVEILERMEKKEIQDRQQLQYTIGERGNGEEQLDLEYFDIGSLKDTHLSIFRRSCGRNCLI